MGELVVPAEPVVEPVVPAEPVVPIKEQVSQQTTAFLNALTPTNAGIFAADAAGTLGSFVLEAILPNPDGEPEPEVVVAPVEAPSETFEAASQQTEQILDFLASNIDETLSNVHDASTTSPPRWTNWSTRSPSTISTSQRFPFPHFPHCKTRFQRSTCPASGRWRTRCPTVSAPLPKLSKTLEKTSRTPLSPSARTSPSRPRTSSASTGTRSARSSGGPTTTSTATA